MQMPSDVVAAIADWFSLVISRSAVAGKEEIVGVLCLLHTVQEKRRVTQPRGVFSQNLCLWLSVPKRLYYREPFLIFSVLAECDLRFGVVQGDGNFFPPIFLQKAGL